MDIDPLDDEWDDETPSNIPLPPGEEAMFFSNAGGDQELCHELFAEEKTSKRVDGRTRHDRTLIRTQEWEAQRDELVDAYLTWHSGIQQTLGEVACWTMHCIDFFEHGRRVFFPPSTSTRINVTLALHGYMGTAPIRPAVAISFKCLEAYRQVHRVCPRFSIQAQVRALCYLHMVPMESALVDQFSIAFDMYLEILHHVDQKVNVALRRDTPNWRMLNACAPCMYKLNDESPLSPALLVTMDGNQSLKLVDDQFRSGKPLADTRTARTDLWIPPDEVDQFKDEVQAQRLASQGPGNRAKTSTSQSMQGPSGGAPPPSVMPSDIMPPFTSAPPASHLPTPPSLSSATSLSPVVIHKRAAPTSDNDDCDDDDGDGDEDDDWFDIDEPSPDPTSICVKRWRNAGPESRKRMFALFNITGIFVALCRHGHCLVMCDMVRSGELMKYPLAIVNKLIEVYGSDIKIGYDIACAFSKIVRRSSLGARVAALNVTGVVPAFHGHSHNRSCQVRWHPLYMPGVGKEDFEGCERCFSESNALAPGTRLSTAFHRHQAIEQFFTFWSDQKHSESGKFLYDNYCQALEIIEDDTEALKLLLRQLSISTVDLERYLEEERAYFKSRRIEPPEVTAELDYLESLTRLKAAGHAAVAAKSAAEHLDTFVQMDITDSLAAKKKQRQINSVRTKARTAQARWEILELEVLRREEDLGIDKRWQPGEEKYDAAFRELGHRKYRLALDKLETLVVRRLFELSKLQLSGTGYKLREKIGKALKARAEAIKRALAEYNLCARGLSPPRDELLWADILDMSTLADFDLLRDTRQDIRAMSWAKPPQRRAMNLHFNILRAKEEIYRLNIEISRLFTFMVDEHAAFYEAVCTNLLTNPSIAHELSRRWQQRQGSHRRIVQYLQKTSKLSGFTGKLEAGSRLGCVRERTQQIPLPQWAKLDTDTEELDLNDVVAAIPGATTEHEEEVFVDYVDSLGEQLA
ncbi:hypothetical protein C8Q73DRAFT_674646 [Cubamyces lactineus]|nr:hypothetical protein C8Q73DRAFT_674646 [Cubamyces lactineus]